jgi:hypothetical protein
MATADSGCAVVKNFFFYVSQQNSSGDLDQKLTGFVGNLAGASRFPCSNLDFVTFKHHIRRVPEGNLPAWHDSPAWRGLLKLSLPTAEAPETNVLEDVGNDRGTFDIILYPPYQFATQVLLGGSLNLRRPDVGLAFAVFRDRQAFYTSRQLSHVIPGIHESRGRPSPQRVRSLNGTVFFGPEFVIHSIEELVLQRHSSAQQARLPILGEQGHSQLHFYSNAVCFLDSSLLSEGLRPYEAAQVRRLHQGSVTSMRGFPHAVGRGFATSNYPRRLCRDVRQGCRFETKSWRFISCYEKLKFHFIISSCAHSLLSASDSSRRDQL